MTAAEAATGLTFVIPVRHQATVGNWDAVRDRLAITLRSIAGQTDPRWNAVIVANEGAGLPDLPPGVEALRVAFPPAFVDRVPLRSPAFYDIVRLDKGRRVLAGMLWPRALSHAMVVDCDDLISNRLAGQVQRHPEANGWFFRSGYLYSGGGEVALRQPAFHKLCGTSHIVRRDLLRLPPTPEAAADDHVRRRLGAHRFLREDLHKDGTPLDPLPFPGTIYRMGHAESSEKSRPLGLHLRRAAAGAGGILGNVSAPIPLDEALVAEFFNGPPG